MSENSSESKSYFKKAALLGSGLIGGSIGILLREKRLVEEIIAFDIDPEASREAVTLGAADSRAESVFDAVHGADLVILAVPVLSTVGLLKELLAHIKPGAVITDVGSTKGSTMAAVEQVITPGLYFIGGHPMAGSEESGIAGADPALLENAIYVLTPAPDTPREIVERLTAMLEKAGAQPLLLDPFLHDRIVASVSHLPHLVATALVRSVAESGDMELVRTLAAGGFRDSTRIALGNPEVWRDICISNRWALLAAFKQFKEALNSLEKSLAEPDPEAIREYLLQARDYRRNIPHRGRGILPELFEMVVLVRDEPGVLGRLTTLLGEAGINIDAIEILHVRELSGGSIRLGFRSSEHQQEAIELLNSKGYHTHPTISS